MRIHRFFVENPSLHVGDFVYLSDFDSKHARKSLRLSKLDKVVVFNGKQEANATIQKITNKEVLVKIEKLNLEVETFNKSPQIVLYQSLIKTKNFELVLEKATELGVSSIVPVQTEYSVVNVEKINKKLDRWSKIIISACKQSERVNIPEIQEPSSFKEAIAQAQEDSKLFFTIRREKQELDFIQLQNVFKREFDSIGLFIGPEGGFSTTENQAALKNGWNLVQPFDSILRSETAAIAALGIVNYSFSLPPYS